MATGIGLETLVEPQLDERATNHAEKLEVELQKDGESIGAVDALVAATALDYDEPVVTADTEDFELVSDLRVETY